MNGLRTKLERNLGGGILLPLLTGCLLVLWPFVTAPLWAHAALVEAVSTGRVEALQEDDQ